ncbi:MAG: tryptophan 7-halogenase [Elusimicrobia bacterium]|nr:tryptophan 7-halogenase [Elusimicrobiota bacterium]
MSKRWDLVVVGAGPAGCTLATLVKKHEPKRRVLILEKCPGPRHHIGESLLPGIVPILKEMGVFEKIDSAGFPRKIGANYVWGRGREVWENDFNDVNVKEMIERRGGIPEKIEYAWQVRRSLYDEILLRHAQENGVEVLRGTAALEPIEKAGRVVGLRARGAAGERVLSCEFLADCSGQSGFLSRFKKVREYNPELKNVAAYAYFQGAPWKYSYNGHPDKTKIFICSTGCGWFWYIPIAKDIVSVGLVTSQAHLKSTGLTPEDLFQKELARCAEVAPLLARARRIEDFDGSGQSFFTVNDWSYLNVSASGPGWLAAGDAAVFVDPILSSGVTLAHLGAHRAAYTLLTQWSRSSAPQRAGLWRDYDLFCRESAEQFLALALFWYGNDRRAEKWWGRAKELQKAWLPVEMSDHLAFVTVSAGLTRFYERAFTAAGLASERALRPKDLPFYVSVLGESGALEESAARAYADSDRPRLLFPFVEEVVYFPAPGGARLQPAKRVRFVKRDPKIGLNDALNPRLVVTRYHLQLLGLIDGARTAGEVFERAAKLGVPAWWLEGPARSFLTELSIQGVLSAVPSKPALAGKGA